MPIYSGVWEPSEVPRRAALVFAHGFGSHVHDPRGIEDNLLRPLTRHGYAVMGFDSRGQGRTGTAAGRFGDIGGGEARMADLETVIAAASEHFEGSDVFLMGHGLGASEELAFMSLRGDTAEGQAVQGLVLLAPCCASGSRISLFLRFLIRLESLRGTTHMEVRDLWRSSDLSKDFADARLCSGHVEHIFRTCDADGSGMLNLQEFDTCINKEMGLGLSADEIQETFARFDGDGDGRVSIDELLRHVAARSPEDDYCLSRFKVDTDFAWYDRAMDASRISAPLLLIHGKNDRVDRFSDAAAFVRAAPAADKTVRAFESLRHGVAMDMDAPRVVEEVVHWLDARTQQ